MLDIYINGANSNICVPGQSGFIFTSFFYSARPEHMRVRCSSPCRNFTLLILTWSPDFSAILSANGLP